MIKKRNLIVIIIVVIAIAAAALYLLFATPKKTIDVSKGHISKIETMAQLCAVEIYSEVPVLDTINDKVMFAVQKQKGSVSFDLEDEGGCGGRYRHGHSATGNRGTV